MPRNESDCAIDVEGLADGLRTKVADSNFLMPRRCSIFRIPATVIRQNENAYVPSFISICPFHRQSLRAADAIKSKYLLDLVSRLARNGTIHGNPDVIMRVLTGEIASLHREALEYYAGDIGMDTAEFVEVLVLDGCFIIELLRKIAYEDLRDDNDPIFTVSRMIQYLYHDLILLENQIPWMVLERLFHLTRTTTDRKPLVHLASEFFGDIFSTKPLRIPSLHDLPQCNHILNLLRNLLVLQSHIHHHLRELEWKQLPRGELEWKHMPTAASLEESGIQFIKLASRSILDMKFKNGILQIPTLRIHETTDALFRNLVSLELSCPFYSGIITSYALIFDNLIQTTADMRILCESGIVDNRLRLEDATRIFNHPYEEYACVRDNFYLPLIHKVYRYQQQRNYYIRRWRVYRRELKRVYFRHPWAVLSTIAASVMLILTFLQTFFTIIK